jgi:hypothetical protein
MLKLKLSAAAIAGGMAARGTAFVLLPRGALARLGGKAGHGGAAARCGGGRFVGARPCNGAPAAGPAGAGGAVAVAIARLVIRDAETTAAALAYGARPRAVATGDDARKHARFERGSPAVARSGRA